MFKVEECRVLIVHTDEKELTRLDDALSHAGFQVRTASSGNEALALLTEETDVVLTVVDMPGGSGLELLRWIRLNKPLVQVFLLDSSVYKMSWDSTLVPDGIFTRPLTAKALIETLARACRLAEYQKRQTP